MCCGVGGRLASSNADIESLNESSGQYTSSKCASRARRVTGLAETAGARRWVSSELVPTENPGRFHYLEQGDLQEMFQGLTCVLLLYCCTSRHHCRRPPWEKRKIRDMTTVDPNPTQTLIGMLWGDECFLDAVGCEGSRLIRPMWLLCVERL